MYVLVTKLLLANINKKKTKRGFYLCNLTSNFKVFKEVVKVKNGRKAIYFSLQGVIIRQIVKINGLSL